MSIKKIQLKALFEKAWQGKIINLRPRQSDEIVLENDNLEGNQYLIDQWLGEVKNRIDGKYRVEVWNHNGKCPHLHIKNIQGLEKIDDDKELVAFRKAFMTQFGGKDIDLSLGDKRKLVPAENQVHWKKQFGDPDAQHYTKKELIEVWNEEAINRVGKVQPLKNKKKVYFDGLESEARQVLEVDDNGFISCPSKDHEDKEPSCKLYFESNSYYCFGCQKSGKITELFPNNKKNNITKSVKSEITENVVSVIHKEFIIYTLAVDNNPEMWYYKDGIYLPDGESIVRERTREILDEGFTNLLANEVIIKVQADTFINPKEFFKNENPNLIPLQNGVYDLDKYELIPFNPEYRFFQKIPIEYKPNLDCPNIKKHFKDVLENEEDSLVAQELLGFLLYKEYFIEKAFMFHGSGRNGKSKTLDLIKLFLGEDNVTSVPIQKLESDQYATSLLFGKLGNLAGDLNPTALKETGQFKEATGRGLLHANRKHKNHITFVNYAKMVFSCNDLPRTYDLTPAFWKRWVFFNFPFTFCSKQELEVLSEKERKSGKFKLMDPLHSEKICTQEELNGCFNWAVEGLKRLRKNGDFSSTNTSEDIQKHWIRKSNSFQAFLQDCVESDFDCKIPVSELNKSYQNYVIEHKLKKIGKKEQENNIFTEFGADKERKSKKEMDDYNTIWAYVGVKFKNGFIDEQNFSYLNEETKNNDDSFNLVVDDEIFNME